MIHVGSRVRNVGGRGEWDYGTVIERVPAGRNAKLVAMRAGLPDRDVNSGVRDEDSWLVEIRKPSGRARVYWPFVNSLEEA